MKRRNFLVSLAAAVVAIPLALPAHVAPDVISDKAGLDAYWEHIDLEKPINWSDTLIYDPDFLTIRKIPVDA